MPAHDIIVVGASAGGVEALQALVGGLPAGFPGTLFVVLHLPPRQKSFLPQILSRAGNCPAVHPVDGDAIEPGMIYVAPPDYHLVVEQGHVHLSMGPAEQRHRPCVNVLFRSAALAYGERVVGIVLSGQLDDGTAGLWEVKRRGGIAVVQNPEQAAFPSMPLNALREVDADYMVPVAQIGPLLARLAEGGGEKRTSVGGIDMEPKLTDVTCPDCRGTIWEMPRGSGVEFRCRVGHCYSPKSMLAEHFATQEKALYAAIVALEEGASLALRLAPRVGEPAAQNLHDEARRREEEAESLKRILRERKTFDLD